MPFFEVSIFERNNRALRVTMHEKYHPKHLRKISQSSIIKFLPIQCFRTLREPNNPQLNTHFPAILCFVLLSQSGGPCASSLRDNFIKFLWKTEPTAPSRQIYFSRHSSVNLPNLISSLFLGRFACTIRRQRQGRWWQIEHNLSHAFDSLHQLPDRMRGSGFHVEECCDLKAGNTSKIVINLCESFSGKVFL